MICYTLSDCVLKNINNDANNKRIFCDLLFIFPASSNPHKLAVDSKQKIIDIYLSYDNLAIRTWLQQMGHEPSSWESVNVDNIDQATSNEDIFLMVCSQTEDKMLIVYHHHDWTKDRYYDKRNILFETTPIRVLDRDEAIKLLALSEEDVLKQKSIYESDLQKPVINQTINKISDSIVAMDGSSVKNAKVIKK
jgi:hypothetical protein